MTRVASYLGSLLLFFGLATWAGAKDDVYVEVERSSFDPHAYDVVTHHQVNTVWWGSAPTKRIVTVERVPEEDVE